MDPEAAGGCKARENPALHSARISIVNLILVLVWLGDFREHILLKNPNSTMEHQSFGSTRLVLSLLVEATEGALVRISPAPLLFCADRVPGLVLSALHGIAHVILTASLESGWHCSSHFTGKETETHKC